MYDTRGRLTAITDRADPPNTVAESRYNGLGYLIGEHADFNADSGVDGDDPWRWFVYDERWRVLASYRGTDEAVESDAKERFVYHAAGFRSSGSYIDDLVLRDRDAVQPEADPANTDPAQTWLFESDGVLEERVFICQNWRADVALVVDSSGAAVQRAWYTAYGVPTGADRADLNGDGVVDSADASVFSAWHGASDIRADWNLDGTVNSTDTIAYLNAYNSAATLGGRGVLSSAALDLRVGYAGYRWDAFTQRYHVRHRVYEPYMGWWQSRDPIEYFGDSYNLYEYVGGRAIIWRDPFGLQVVPQPVVPRDDRPYRAPYDIFPGESIESIIKKQRDAIQDAGKQKQLNTSVEAMDCCFTLKQGYQDATDGLFRDDWDGVLREAKDGTVNIAMEYATAGLLCAGFGAADDIAKLCQNLVKKNNGKNRVVLPDGRIVDLQGKPHYNKQGCGSDVPTPHVKTPEQRLHPDKKTRRDVRPATPEDLRDVEDYLDKRNAFKELTCPQFLYHCL